MKRTFLFSFLQKKHLCAKMVFEMCALCDFQIATTAPSIISSSFLLRKRRRFPEPFRRSSSIFCANFVPVLSVVNRKLLSNYIRFLFWSTWVSSWLTRDALSKLTARIWWCHSGFDFQEIREFQSRCKCGGGGCYLRLSRNTLQCPETDGVPDNCSLWPATLELVNTTGPQKR